MMLLRKIKYALTNVAGTFVVSIYQMFLMLFAVIIVVFDIVRDFFKNIFNKMK